MAKQILYQGKHRKFRFFFQNAGETQGILFGQVVNFLILDIDNIAKLVIFSVTFSLKLNVSAKSVSYTKMTQILEIGRGKISSQRGKTERNLKKEFKWGPRENKYSFKGCLSYISDNT